MCPMPTPRTFKHPPPYADSCSQSSGTQLATFSAKIHLGHPAKRQKGCINYYCYYYSSTGDAKYIDSYIVHCCLILRVLSSKKWHSFINFMTLRIKDMRLSSIVLLIAHQNRILTKQLVSICTNYYISGLGAFNRPLPVQVMLVPFCASFTYSVRSRVYYYDTRCFAEQENWNEHHHQLWPWDFPRGCCWCCPRDTWGFWANRNSLHHGPT